LYSSLDFSEDSFAVFPFNRDKLRMLEGLIKEEAILSFKGVVSLSESV
jgi:hypothetical protein